MRYARSEAAMLISWANNHHGYRMPVRRGIQHPPCGAPTHILYARRAGRLISARSISIINKWRLRRWLLPARSPSSRSSTCTGSSIRCCLLCAFAATKRGRSRSWVGAGRGGTRGMGIEVGVRGLRFFYFYCFFMVCLQSRTGRLLVQGVFWSSTTPYRKTL